MKALDQMIIRPARQWRQKENALRYVSRRNAERLPKRRFDVEFGRAGSTRHRACDGICGWNPPDGLVGIKRSGSINWQKIRRTLFATVDPLRLIHPTFVVG